MKHIKLFNELNSSTYLSAADKLNTKHPKRSAKLRQWATKNSDKDINYLSPIPFEVENGDFYITSVSENDTWIYATLESIDDAIYVSMEKGLATKIFPKIEKRRIQYGTKKNNNGVLKGDFYLKSRKEAREFINVIKKELGKEVPFSANDLYRSQ